MNHPYLQNKKILVEAAPAGDRFQTILTPGAAALNKDKPYLFIGFNNQRGFDIPINVINRGLKTQKGTVIFDQTKKNVCPDINGKPELTELEYFEKILNRPLSPFLPPEQNYWRTGENKSVTILEGKLELDLRNPIDVIKWKILLANEDVIAANREIAKKFDTGKWDFIMRDANSVDIESVEEGLVEAQAWDYFNSIKESKEKMIKALSVVYEMEISLSNSEVSIKAALMKKMKEDYEVFNKGMKDPNFETKYLIRRLLAHKILKYDAGFMKYSYEGEPIGDINELVVYLQNPVNSKVLVELESRLALAEK